MLYSCKVGLCKCNVDVTNRDCVTVRVCSGPGNPVKCLNFSLAFSWPGKSLKMLGGPGIFWKSVNSSNKSFLKNINLRAT